MHFRGLQLKRYKIGFKYFSAKQFSIDFKIRYAELLSCYYMGFFIDFLAIASSSSVFSEAAFSLAAFTLSRAVR